MDNDNTFQTLVSRLGDDDNYIKKVQVDKNKPNQNNSIETQNDEKTRSEIFIEQDIKEFKFDEAINGIHQGQNKVADSQSNPINLSNLQAKLDFEYKKRVPYFIESQKHKAEENQKMQKLKEKAYNDQFWVDVRNDYENQSENLTWLDNLSANVNMLLKVVDGMESNNAN